MEQNISNQFIQRSLLEFNSHRSDTYIALITARVSQLDNDDYIILEKLYNNIIEKYNNIIEEKWAGCHLGIYLDEDYELYVKNRQLKNCRFFIHS